MAIITISRGSLSGGRALAERLARELGYPLLGREVLQEAARKLGAPEEVLQAKMETPPGLWARVTRERERYVLAVRTALAEASVGGRLVYHGLAGQFLLRGVPQVLRVRLLAPLELRVRTLLETHPGMPRGEALEIIQSVDEERSRWVRVMYGADASDPFLYDMTLNLRTLSLESVCRAIQEATSQPRFRITPQVEEVLASFAAECRGRLTEALER